MKRISGGLGDMAGRPRKPHTLKVLDGDFEKNPKRRKPVRKPEGVKPTKTKLTGSALELYQKVTGYSWVGGSDVEGLHAMCWAWQAICEIGPHIAREPMDKELAARFKQHTDTFHKYAAQFGLMPMSREKLIAQDEENKEDRFLA